MSVALLNRLLFTVETYHKMIASGVLTKYDRVELIRGEIVQMSPISPLHAGYVNRLSELFIWRLIERVRVRVQNPVELDETSELQPDLALVRRRPNFYKAGHPRPEDVFLLVEVADSTVRKDREVKIPLYAEDNILEVWLVDINEQCLEVYREPSVNGYQSVQKLESGDTVTIQAFPDVVFAVDEILG